MSLELEEDYYLIKTRNGELVYAHVGNIDQLLTDIINVYKGRNPNYNGARREGKKIIIFGYAEIEESEVIDILIDFLEIFFSKSLKA